MLLVIIIALVSILFFVLFFVQELVEYYKHQSLREGFRSLDTALLFPYKAVENQAGHASNRSSGMCKYSSIDSPVRHDTSLIILD